MKRRSTQAGLTLVELLVSMALVGLMVAMVFSLFIQSSMAYRTGAQIAELQQVLVAANGMVLKDLRNAGNRTTAGFQAANGFHRAIEIDNDDTGPDEIRLFYASSDSSAITAWGATQTGSQNRLTVTDPGTIIAGDLILIADVDVYDDTLDPAPPVAYTSCVGKVATVVGNTITLATTGAWGSSGSTQCNAVFGRYFPAYPNHDTVVFELAALGYRIDPDRRELGVLQRSKTAGFEDDWEDMGIGFTDLQVATRWHEPTDATDEDGNGDPELDWYSGEDQETLAAPNVPTELTISFVMRTSKKVSGVTTAATPNLTETGNVDHNPVGDRAAVQLEGVADASRPDELKGDHLYRYSTSRVDLRNMEIR